MQTVFELGWSRLTNRELLGKAETSFEVFITTDQQVRYQQNLSGRKLAIIVLMTTSWPRLQIGVEQVLEAVNSIQPGAYMELSVP